MTKGTKKLRMVRNKAKYCQPPCSRILYQMISSGRFPAHMITHCENEKYAQTMVKVSIHLP